VRDSVHFWTGSGRIDIEGWDPDAEPARHANGKGHAIVELCKRVARRGRLVSAGPSVVAGSRAVIVYLGDLVQYSGKRHWTAQARLALGVARTGARLVVVRGDLPLAVAVPRYASCVVWPNPTASRVHGGVWLPLLPQRALVARRAERAARIETLVLQTYPENVPDWVRDGSLAAPLLQIGVELRVNEQPEQWPDFSDADLVLCARRSSAFDLPADPPSYPRKPPTKLINAWVAGAIPLVFPETGYLDLANPGVDAIVIESPDDVLTAVAALRGDPQAATQLFGGSIARGSDFTTDRVLEHWEGLLWGDLGPSRRLAAVAVAATTVPLAVAVAVARRVQRRVPGRRR